MNRQHYELLISRRLLSGMPPALLATVLLVFSSCSDDELVSATDSKTMPFSSYSTTVRPGRTSTSIASVLGWTVLVTTPARHFRP